MKRYKNLSRNSGVRGYDPKDESIDVQFKDGGIYSYDEGSVGTSNLQKMQRAAEKGRGLSTIIATDQTVRQGYSTRRKGAK